MEVLPVWLKHVCFLGSEDSASPSIGWWCQKKREWQRANKAVRRIVRELALCKRLMPLNPLGKNLCYTLQNFHAGGSTPVTAARERGGLIKNLMRISAENPGESLESSSLTEMIGGKYSSKGKLDLKKNVCLPIFKAFLLITRFPL